MKRNAFFPKKLPRFARNDTFSFNISTKRVVGLLSINSSQVFIDFLPSAQIYTIIESIANNHIAL